MALRLFTREEFFQELERLGLEKTDHETETTQAWQTKSGHHILVPKNGIEIPEQGERFPDNWVAEIYVEVERHENSDD